MRTGSPFTRNALTANSAPPRRKPSDVLRAWSHRTSPPFDRQGPPNWLVILAEPPGRCYRSRNPIHNRWRSEFRTVHLSIGEFPNGDKIPTGKSGRDAAGDPKESYKRRTLIPLASQQNLEGPRLVAHQADGCEEPPKLNDWPEHPVLPPNGSHGAFVFATVGEESCCAFERLPPD